MRLAKIILGFSVLLISLSACIDIKINGQGGPRGNPQAGCGWPFSVCPGIAIMGEVIKKETTGQQTIYSVKENSSDTVWNIAVPPGQILGDEHIEKEDKVEIGSRNGVQTINKRQ